MLTEEEKEGIKWLDKHAKFNEDTMKYEELDNMTNDDIKLFKKYTDDIEKRKENLIKNGE